MSMLDIANSLSQAELAMEKCRLCLETLELEYTFDKRPPRDLSNDDTTRLIHGAKEMSIYIHMALDYILEVEGFVKKGYILCDRERGIFNDDV